MLVYIAAWFPIVAIAIGNGLLKDVFRGRVWPAIPVGAALPPYLFYRLHA